jgi:hypothetical protein
MFYPNQIQHLTPVQAIQYGRRRVFYVFLAIFTIAGAIVQIFCDELPILLGILLFCVCLFIPCWYYANAIGRWRIWAFERVTDKRKLYHYAVEEVLIPSDQHWLFPIEMSLNGKQKAWQKIQAQLQLQPFSQNLNDPTVPQTVAIRFVKSHALIIVLVVVLVALSWKTIDLLRIQNPKKSERNMPWLFAIIGAYLIYALVESIKQTFSYRRPQITLSPEGILTASQAFNWGIIQQVNVHTTGQGDSMEVFLQLFVRQEKKDPSNLFLLKEELEEVLIPLKNLEVDSLEMRHVLDVFKERHWPPNKSK